MDRITDQQKKAISHYKGPAIVIAGPGSGKTYVITKRVEFLIKTKNIYPSEILVTTFTEKAAEELKVKLSNSLGRNAKLIHISTIHSFCKSMLEEYFLYHEYGADINVLDSESQYLLLDLNKRQLGLATWESNRLIYKKSGYNPIRSYQFTFNQLTQNCINSDEIISYISKNSEHNHDDLELVESYKLYLNLLESEKKIDFALLQKLFYELIIINKDVLDSIQSKFKFILVDEYQDTSPIQDLMFRLISEKHNNLFVVGDEDQSIYGFRGASIRNFTNFITLYPNSQSYLLKVNFRSTKTIVNFSNSVFEKEVKKILESRRRKGEKIKVIESYDSDSTAKETIELIKSLKNKDIIKKYSDVSLLFRSLKYHSEEFIKYLTKESIPFVTFGDGNFVERKEIQTIIYLISYVTQELYNENRFSKWSWWKKDIFLSNFFSFSSSTNDIISNGDFPLYNLNTYDDFISKGFINKDDINVLLNLNHLKFDVEKEKDAFGDLIKGKYSLLKIFYKILNYTGYFSKLMSDPTIHNKEILNNLGKLSEIINRFQEISKTENIKNFLWYIYNTSSDFDQIKLEDENSVKLMTVHKSKGLEFPVVIMCCMNEGRFPLKYRSSNFFDIPTQFLLDKTEASIEVHFQEERRLFYVGITRTQDNLIFTTSTRHRVRKWAESRFLSILPDNLLSCDFKLSTEKNYKVAITTPMLNYSAINSFIDCPLRYQLIYSYGFSTPPSIMQYLGSFIHNVLQNIHEQMRKNKDLSPRNMLDLIKRYWLNLPITKKQNDAIKENLIQDFVRYYNYAKENYKDILAIEESFSHIDDNMIISGKVDLIVRDKHNKINLVDFKARKQEGIEKTNVDKQLEIYKYCLDNEYKIDNLIAHTFSDNEVTYFSYSEENTKDFLDKISKKIYLSDFHKQKNSFCRQCQFNFYCEDSI